MGYLERRIEKLEGVCRPQRQPRPSLVVLYEHGQPINAYFAEVLRLNREAEAGGEDVRLSVFYIPAGTKIRQ